MPARCHNDSCSISWDEVTTLSGLAYEASVIVDNTLICDGDGLGVVISPNAGNTVVNAGNGLYASVPDAFVIPFVPGTETNQHVDPGANLASPQMSANTHTYTNATGRDAVVIVQGQFNYAYAILGEDSPVAYDPGDGLRAGTVDTNTLAAPVTPSRELTPFNANVAFRLLANINAAATAAVISGRASIGGLMFISNDLYEKKSERRGFSYAVDLPAGSTLNVRADCFYEGPSQTLNVYAGGSGALATDGFSLDVGRFVVLPHG